MRTLTRHRRTSMFCCVWVGHFGCMVLCSSLRLGCSACFRHFFVVFVNAWNAQFDSDSRVPLVVFSDDFGIQKLFFCSFLAILGCWRALGHPGQKKSEKRAEKETQLETILGPLASFGPLGCSFGCPRGQKNASRRRASAI